MRKVWNTLVVLGVLLCMVMSLGVTADAAPAQDDAAIFAVSGTQLQPENIGVMGTQNPSCLVVDVDGLDEGQSAAGYNVVYVGSDSGVMTDYACIWPGAVQMFQVGTQLRPVVLVGVGEASTTDEINAAVSGYLGDDPTVIAVGPAAAAAAVSGCADVDLFMTTGLDDAAAAGTIPVVNVGKEAEAPVSLVQWNEDGTTTVSAIPVPQPVADPGVDPAEQPEPDPASTQDGTEPLPEEQPPADEVTYCSIIYDGNGRDSGSVPDVTDFIAGQTYFFANNGYAREGYEFVGWKMDGDDTVYQPGDEVVINQSVTVYAQWQPIQVVDEPVDGTGDVAEPDETSETGDTVNADITTYTVTYNCGEGAGDNVTFEFNETSEKEIILPDGNAFTAPEGKRFVGWKIDGTEDVWEANVPYTVSASVTFVAQYQTVFTVAYDFGDSGNTNYSDEVFEGATYGLGGEPAVIPEGKTFGGWLVNGELVPASSEITVTSNVTVTPQWDDVESPDDPSEFVDGTINVTYKSGIEGMDDTEPETVDMGGNFLLRDNPFTFPEDVTFVGWLQAAVVDGVESVDPNGEVLEPGTELMAGETDLVFVAKTVKMSAVTVTYLPGDGSDMKFEEQTEAFEGGSSVQHTLAALPADFTVPEGKTFGGWKIGDSTYQPGDSVTVSENTTVTAIWNDVEKEKVDPAVDTDPLMYTQGATDRLEVRFKAKIDAVSVDNAALTLGSQYSVVEDGDTSTVSLNNDYLNGLTEGDHTLNVTFVATDTTEYTPNTRTLTVKAAPAATDVPIKKELLTWDRSADLVISCDKYNRGNPIKFEISYTTYYKEAVKDRDYTIDGTNVVVHTSLVSSWQSATYGFRLTFDGAGTDLGENTVDLNILMTGEAKQPQPESTASTATGSSGYVTGEGVNLRAGAGTDSQVLRTVAKGTKITIYSISNGWAYVSVDGVTGYMSANYVAYDNATPTATPAGATSPATGDTNNVVLYIVILVVLIIALAAVLIVVVKRRKQ